MHGVPPPTSTTATAVTSYAVRRRGGPSCPDCSRYRVPELEGHKCRLLADRVTTGCIATYGLSRTVSLPVRITMCNLQLTSITISYKLYPIGVVGATCITQVGQR